jgi:cation diffusion facilitator CzcD-associated flavoprotein CzcO
METTQYDVVIVGAGFAGLYLLHRMRVHAPAGPAPYVERCDQVAAAGYDGFELG